MSNHKNYLAAFNNLIMPMVSKVQRLMSVCLEAEIKQHDLSLAEFRIVGLLMGEDQGYSQKQLAQKLGISAPSLSVSIASLEKKHWVERVADQQDQRIKRIRVSPQANFSSIAQVITSLDKQATKGISQKDLATSHKVLQAIINNVNKMNSGEH
jgi:DNA-binding MarR family transcriptional regulator